MSSIPSDEGHQIRPSGDGTEQEPDIERLRLPSESNEKIIKRPGVGVLDPFFNFELVVFEVENVLFRVPKLAFLNSSEPENPFLKIFSLPPPDANNVEGASTENPIVLDNECAADFRAFLHALYPWTEHARSFEENVGVLRLATKWNFDKLRCQTLENLACAMSDKGPALNIHMGNEFKVSSWLASGLTEIILSEDLGLDHLRSEPFHLDWETIAKIYFIQDLMGNDNNADCWKCGATRKCRCRTTDYVNDIFANEIAAAKHPNDKVNAGYYSPVRGKKKKGGNKV